MERHPERFEPLLRQAERQLGQSWTLTPEQVDIVFQALWLAASEHEPAMQRSVELAERTARERFHRALGGPRAAQKRHAEHVNRKVKPCRDEYRQRLEAGESSADIIKDMARKYDYPVKHMRDLIKPRSMQTAQ